MSRKANEDINKLPKWVREELEKLNNKITVLEKKLNFIGVKWKKAIFILLLLGI